jgi:hypothetical protein
MTTHETPELPTTTATLPAPVPPPHLVRLRVDVDGDDYRAIKHIAIDTGTSVNSLVCEAVRLLRSHYSAQGLPSGRRQP